MDEAMTAEGFTRLTYEIEPSTDGVTRLTVTHDLDGAPHAASSMAGGMETEGAGGGWAWVLSDLKTLLETGSGFRGDAGRARAAAPLPPYGGEVRRRRV